MIEILKGFGMEILAYDLYPDPNLDVEYTTLDDLLRRSDVVTLHCPLTNDSKYIINKKQHFKNERRCYPRKYIKRCAC